ncbi:MAG: glycoside hydrolase family 130 protein [Clostridiales bacterium]|nr:glycoside hydrolase family 130 protein [Clostridiales bacterium]
MAKIIGASLPNIPWQDKPQGCSDVLWRYSNNPIVQRNAIPCSNSIFNSAVVPFKGEFAGVFRVDDKRREMRIHSALSKDGFNWNIDHEPWVLLNERAKEVGPFIYGYDPRCCQIDGEYIVTWCNCYHGPTIGVAKTEDFRTYYQLENAFLPFNRNGVMFPEKINGNYAMLSRPSDNGHTPFGDIFYSESPDLCYWGKHRHVMGTRGSWQSTKVGAGPIPIKTDEGWLLFYHGVLTSCNGFVYHFGAALLDLDQPWKVIYRTEPYLLSPQMPYEQIGDVPNVTFPCAALADADTGRIAIYYGGADTVICMCFGQVDEIVDFVKHNSKL